MTDIQTLEQAENLLFNQSKIEEAAELYLALSNSKELAHFCNYRLAKIANLLGDPETAYALYYKAFEYMPNLAMDLYTNILDSKDYVFNGLHKEKEVNHCPLCGKLGTPKWCYPLPEATGFNHAINPIRLWLYCDECHHVFARDYPEQVFDLNNNPRNADPAYFSYYSEVLSNLRQYTNGKTLFEVGIGASECLLAAREVGYDCFGIDVIERHVEDARRRYELNVETHDFVKFVSERKYDVIIMGDVLEHVSKPIEAIRKAAELLADDGALWGQLRISTVHFP
ncbi:hypothetical protein FACS1894111_13400 [Clostridia bacterium]|nr:hypothetical protein FACS1894111_13400 [Clostridia bacterium]